MEGVFMNTRTKLAIAVSAAMWMIPISRAVAGIDVAAGDWKLDFSGNVNAFYVGTSCDNVSATQSITGGLACTGDNSSAVRNGLLPAAFVFGATTRQSDLDIAVTIGFYPGINSSLGGVVNGPGNPSALQSPGIDARQAFFTFGDSSWGTMKLGRDIGIFGKDAILDDMTLLGVGTAAGNQAPSNTSLGRIGIGYIYTDWEPQITYTTPNWSGFSGSIGVFQPLDSDGYTSHNSPQIQGGLAYSWGDPKLDSMTGKIWFNVVSQQLKLDSSTPAISGYKRSFTGTGYDGGVKFDVSGFEAVLYAYGGEGVGTTGLYILPTSSTGQTRKSDGGYVQATYKFDKLKIGLSYGLSDLKLADDEEASPEQTLLKRNESGVLGLYYSLTKSVTLVGEFTDTKAEAWSGYSVREKDIALGGILFF
jgi:predicted porin